MRHVDLDGKKRNNGKYAVFLQSLGRNVPVSVYLHPGQYTIAHPFVCAIK